MSKYTPAQAAAAARYDARTYNVVPFKLRKGEDDDLIEALEQGKDGGFTKREILREWYEASQAKTYTLDEIKDRLGYYQGRLTPELIEHMMK